MAESANNQAATAAQNTSKTSRALAALQDHASSLFEKHARLKAELDRAAKGIAALGLRLGDPLALTRLPIDDSFIDQAVEALKGGGKNIKTLQRELGIFDPAELTRKRKALVAARVTCETENYLGTRTTFVELAPPLVEDYQGGMDDDDDDLVEGQGGQDSQQPTRPKGRK